MAAIAATVARLSPVISPYPPPAGLAGAHSSRGSALPASLAHPRRRRTFAETLRPYPWPVGAGERGRTGVRIPFRDPGWVATIVTGSVALALALTMLLLRVFGTSELAVIPTEAWPWSSESVGVDGVGFDTQFRPGDRVAAMDGIPMTTWVSEALRPPW